METACHATPLGVLKLTERNGALTGIVLSPRQEAAVRDSAGPARGTLLREACRQLDAYFEGRLSVFDLPVDLKGTEFQLRVWAVLRDIPYGQTLTYGETAELAGSRGAARAAGGACRSNPVLLVVPCHRVVGSGGRLAGFAAGLPAKRFLLAHEGIHLKDEGRMSHCILA